MGTTHAKERLKDARQTTPSFPVEKHLHDKISTRFPWNQIILLAQILPLMVIYRYLMVTLPLFVVCLFSHNNVTSNP
jgi:hypothetical protein